jgi:DNA invertase Pin-like site-specific DNA recombinase
MKVFGYARVSTEEQVKSGSLSQQIEQIKKYCELHGHELLEIFTDAGISALKQRPGMEKLMERARKGECEAVVVTKLDRWGRSVKHLVTSIDELKRLGVHFISIGDNIDTSTPNGRLLFHILSAFAEFEREIIRERMQAGRERAKAQGKQLHRPRKKLPLKEIRRLYCEVGLSATAIAKLLGVSPNTVLSRLREMGVKIR